LYSADILSSQSKSDEGGTRNMCVHPLLMRYEPQTRTSSSSPNACWNVTTNILLIE
jgi:hypothetical protein